MHGGGLSSLCDDSDSRAGTAIFQCRGGSCGVVVGGCFVPFSEKEYGEDGDPMQDIDTTKGASQQLKHRSDWGCFVCF